ncbi:hypothetical protein [Neptuniibacter sp. QD37_11]|uniref:hypothetical protein n=1 Tax=Neptuniibacter sp. QD37_11 TaxID=3398209 RepID=UPI0039F62613
MTTELEQSHPKALLKSIAPFVEKMTEYPPNTLTERCKPKRRDPIIDASEAYYSAYEVRCLLPQIEMSYLLAGNEVIIKPFTEECGQLLAAAKFCTIETEAYAKPCQEVQQYYKTLIPLFKRKECITAFLKDMDSFAEAYGFEYDKREILSQVEVYENEHYLKLCQNNKARLKGRHAGVK